MAPGSAAPQAGGDRARVMADAVVSQVDRVAAAADVTGLVVHTYTHAMSGFVVKGPTPNQLQALLRDPSVVAIWPNERLKLVSFAALLAPQLSCDGRDSGLNGTASLADSGRPLLAKLLPTTSCVAQYCSTSDTCDSRWPVQEHCESLHCSWYRLGHALLSAVLCNAEALSRACRGYSTCSAALMLLHWPFMQESSRATKALASSQ